jgi:hypothetical protein
LRDFGSDIEGDNMDAYVLGAHEGDLPTGLLTAGEPGNRIRVMARLEGDSHDVYYAIEAPDAAAIEALVQSIVGSGTVIHKRMTASEDDQIKRALDGVPHGPSWLVFNPIFKFLWFEAEDIIEAAHLAIDRIGGDRIAAAIDGDGHILVEFGHDDEALLDEVIAGFVAATEGTTTGSHQVSAAGLLRA